jgi:TRAP transporter TAXI family solute receptor
MCSFNEGTGWFVMAGAIADEVQSELPEGSQIRVRPFGGSIGCIKLLGQDEADLGINHPVTARWATEGEYVFDQSHDGLRAIVGHFDTYWVLVGVRSETGITSFEQIREEQPAIRLGTGPEGGVSNTGVRQAFEAHGITYDDIESWGGSIERLGLGDMPSAMGNGDIDAMGWVATPGHPTWTEIANSTDVTFMPFTDEGRQTMLDQGWMDMPSMPEGEFGASQEIPSVGWRSMLLTDTGMSDEVARSFARGVVENADSIASAYGAFEVFDPNKAGQEKFTGVPLHSGAQAYLEEEGYL